MLTTDLIRTAVLSGTLTSKFLEMVGPRVLLNARGQLKLMISGRPDPIRQQNR
jgi:hypothetical protein